MVNRNRVNIFFDTNPDTSYPRDIVDGFNEVFQQFDNPFKVVLHKDAADVIVSCKDAGNQYHITILIQKALYDHSSPTEFSSTRSTTHD